VRHDHGAHTCEQTLVVHFYGEEITTGCRCAVDLDCAGWRSILTPPRKDVSA
jgi:hypothetical protein